MFKAIVLLLLLFLCNLTVFSEDYSLLELQRHWQDMKTDVLDRINLAFTKDFDKAELLAYSELKSCYSLIHLAAYKGS